GDLEKGIQLKSAGGYVVGAGCKHASGGTYDWLPQCSPSDAPLAEVPTWLISMIKSRTYYSNVIPMPEWRRLCRERVQDGERHTVVLKLIGHFASLGVDEEVLRELMIGWNHKLAASLRYQ